MSRHLATVGHRGDPLRAAEVLVERDGQVVEAMTGEPIDAPALGLALATCAGYVRNLREALLRVPRSPGLFWCRKGVGAGWIAYVGNQAIAEATSRADLRQELNLLGLDLELFVEMSL